MKEILSQFAAYNQWANQQFVQVLELLSPSDYERDLNSSFKSIGQTFRHLKDVELVWYQRIKLAEQIMLDDKNGSAAETGKALLQYSQQWKEWVDKSSNMSFEHEVAYRNIQGEHFKQPVFQILLHLFNHQTYHRGQLTTMLRQVEAKKIPATDFVLWSRNKKK